MMGKKTRRGTRSTSSGTSRATCGRRDGGDADDVCARTKPGSASLPEAERTVATVSTPTTGRQKPIRSDFSGGFGKTAGQGALARVWGLLRRHADNVQGLDWRHSWTAMSFSSVWLQKLSVAVANQTAIGALRRTPLCTRQRVMGLGESRDGGYESVNMGREGAM